MRKKQQTPQFTNHSLQILLHGNNIAMLVPGGPDDEEDEEEES